MFSPSPVRNGGGIWQSGRAPASDGTNLYLLTGNGFDGVNRDLRNAFLKLRATDLAVLASFQPSDFATLEARDQDLGSGGALLLPGLSAGLTRVAGGGKTGVLFIHDQNLAGTSWFQAAERQYGPSFTPTCSSGLPITYDAADALAPNIHGTPVAWAPSSFRRLYLWAEKDFLKAFDYDTSGGFHQPACPSAATPSITAAVKANPGMPGGMLALSANGGNASTGILWATVPEPDQKRCNTPDVRIGGAWCNANSGVVKGRVYAFNAQTLAPLWDTPVPTFAKFTPPTVAGGKLFVPTFSNKVLVFGPRSSYTPIWTALGGTSVSHARPAIVSGDPGTRLDVFLEGSTTELWNKGWSSGTWSPAGSWQNQGGVLTSNPTATTWGTSRIDVFVRDLSQGVSSKTWTSTAGWSAWFRVGLGGILTSDPVAVSWGSGRIDLFALGTDNQPWHLRYDGGWHPWEALPQLPGGVRPGSRLSVVSWGANRIDVAARAADDSLRHIACSGSCAGATWSAWDNLGGILDGDPAMVSWGSGRLDVFVQALDLQLSHIAFSSGVWSPWEPAPLDGMTMPLGSVVSAISASAGRLDVYARTFGVNDDGGHSVLSHIAFDGTTWTWWEPLLNGGIIVADPVAFHAGGRNQIFVLGLGNTTYATSRPSGPLH